MSMERTTWPRLLENLYPIINILIVLLLSRLLEILLCKHHRNFLAQFCYVDQPRLREKLKRKKKNKIKKKNLK
jgi:hypothetical protein